MLLQPENPFVESFNELPLLNGDRHDDALERNRPHRIEILRKMKLC